MVADRTWTGRGRGFDQEIMTAKVAPVSTLKSGNRLLADSRGGNRCGGWTRRMGENRCRRVKIDGEEGAGYVGGWREVGGRTREVGGGW